MAIEKKFKHVYLIYPRAHKRTGSTTMRVFQLKEIIDAYGSGKFRIIIKDVTNLRLNIAWKLWIRNIENGSILIFCKYAIERVPAETLKELKFKKGCKISVDYIDRSLKSLNFALFDIHIASCSSQFNYLSSIQDLENKVVLITHQADVRLHKAPIIVKNKEICYFGESSNLLIPSNYLHEIKIIPYNGFMTNDDLKSISEFKFHYCVRPVHQTTDMNSFKPPTKIMNAIAVGAIPIISKEQRDAVEIMGDQFPFILREHTDIEYDRLFKKIKFDQDAYNESLKLISLLKIKYSLSNFASNFEKVISSAFNNSIK